MHDRLEEFFLRIAGTLIGWVIGLLMLVPWWIRLLAAATIYLCFVDGLWFRPPATP